jgi:hypothetical protein
MKTILVVLTLALAVPLAAGASPRDRDCARLGKTDCTMKKVTFEEGDELEGGVPSASGEDISVAAPVPFGRLLRLRTNFHDRIVRAAERI